MTEQLYHMVIYVVFAYFELGIGAGLESMTTNPMAWEGSVNPRVSLHSIISVLNSCGRCQLGQCAKFSIQIQIPGENNGASTKLPSSDGYYVRECLTSFWCDKTGARSSCCEFHMHCVSFKFVLSLMSETSPVRLTRIEKLLQLLHQENLKMR